MGQTSHISLYELQLQIATVLESALPLPVWVSAEIAELKVNYSGHCYLELVEKDEGSANGTAKAQARGVVWRSTYARLAPYFEQATGRPLSAGMKVLVKVLVSHHPAYGLSLQVSDIDPTYTVGDMERRKQEVIARLTREGIWDANRGRKVPIVIQRVAVISSASAAGYRDFCREVERSPYAIRTTLFEAVMQGAESERSIAAAFERIEQQSAEFDAVAIIRGGGSTGDLDCFNTYSTASLTARCSLPVLAGIGHDKDVSVTDMVACVQLKTPTAVAAWICDRAAEFDGALERAAILLQQLCAKATHRAELDLQRAEQTLRSATQRTIAERGVSLTYAAERLASGVKRVLEREGKRIDSLALLVERYSPERILQLGFAVARLQSQAIRSIEDVMPGERITIEIADGVLSATINEKQKRDNGGE